MLIVSLLLIFCVFPGQGWLARLFPRLSGLATIDPSLTVLDFHPHLPITIDLILVPLLFLVLYTIAILLFSIRQHKPFLGSLGQRVGAVASGTFFWVVCVAAGGLISYLLLDHLPVRARDSINAIAINADVHIPSIGYKTNSLRGNILSLAGFLAGMAIFIGKVGRKPQTRRSTPLTREQRMTPYQRMLQDKRAAPNHYQSSAPPVLRRVTSANRPCRSEPLLSLQPEAVNYRPLG